MNRDIMNRIEKLEARLIPSESFCLVRMEDGTEREMSVEEWYNDGHATFVRMTRGSDLHAIDLLLRAIDEECGVVNNDME